MLSHTETNRILIVDDTPDNCFLLQSVLVEAGYQIDVASDGLDALRQLRHQLPNLLLLDMHLPGISGMDVLRYIRQDQDLCNLPVLLATASEHSVIDEAIAIGANDFVRLPCNLNDLLCKVERLLDSALVN